MRIVLFPHGCLPFHARTLDERPLGGTETAVIRLAESLSKLGHEVIVVTTLTNPPLSTPLYIPHRALEDIGDVDVLVAVRGWHPLFSGLKAKIRLLWTGDYSDQLQTIGLGDKRVYNLADRILCVSDWHKDQFAKQIGIPRSRLGVLRNGVYLPHFKSTKQDFNRCRLLYSSTPYRGLHLLPEIYLKIKQQVPQVELHVYSGYDVYSGLQNIPQEAYLQFQQIQARLAALPDCINFGNVTQQTLAGAYESGGILLYPNNFLETSCITALEALAGGCPVVTSRLGALPETVGSCGFLIDGVPGSKAYNQKMVTRTVELLTNDSLYSALSQEAKERSLKSNWDLRAKDLQTLIDNIIRKPS